MNKKNLIFIASISLLALSLSVFQYVKQFQAEYTSAAYSTTKPANGHTWGEMECSSTLCLTGENTGLGTSTPGYKLDVQGGQINASGGLCIAGDCKTSWSSVGGAWTTSGNNIYNSNTGNVGIGSTSPGAKLDVNGKIIMRDETVGTDPSNTLITKGYLSSYTSPVTKVLTGTNPVCSGTDTIMRCNNASPCVWYDADQSLGSWTKVMCGPKMASSSSDVFLVYKNHTTTQCSNTTYGGVAGVPVDTGGGNYICKFNASSCSNVSAPSGTAGWTQYQSWSRVPSQDKSVSGICSLNSGSCYGSAAGVGCNCTVPASPWSDSLGYTCSCTGCYTFHGSCSQTCCTTITSSYGTPDQVGCY